MKLQDSPKLAATTVTQSRVSPFAPSRRPQGVRTTHVENSWGKADVTGDLTQIHRDIVDYLVSHEGWLRRRNADGSLDVAFPPGQMLRLLGHEHPGKREYHWLEDMLDDLRVCRFRSTVVRGDVEVTGNDGIVATHAHARKSSTDEYLGYGVRLSARYMGYYEADMPCHTEALTKHIVAIKSGAVQAIVRFMLTHEEKYDDEIDDVLEILGIVGENRKKRARADLRKHESVLAERFSITLDWKRNQVHYVRRPEVWFGDRRKRKSRKPVGRTTESLPLAG